MKYKYPNTDFRIMSDAEIYFNIMCAIHASNFNYIESIANFIINDDKDIIYPHYILLAIEKYLETPSKKNLEIVTILYYIGFRTDSASYLISSNLCDKNRKKLFELELQFAIDHEFSIETVWSRYRKSIYCESYRYIYENYLVKAMQTNRKIKDYFSFGKLMCRYLFFCKTNFDSEIDNDEYKEFEII